MASAPPTVASVTLSRYGDAGPRGHRSSPLLPKPRPATSHALFLSIIRPREGDGFGTRESLLEWRGAAVVTATADEDCQREHYGSDGELLRAGARLLQSGAAFVVPADALTSNTNPLSPRQTRLPVILAPLAVACLILGRGRIRETSSDQDSVRPAMLPRRLRRRRSSFICVRQLREVVPSQQRTYAK